MGSPGQPRGEPRRDAAPDGWTPPAFQLALDPTSERWQAIRRQGGGRRSASNWVVRTLKADLDTDRERGAPRSRLRGSPRPVGRRSRRPSPASAGAGAGRRPASAWIEGPGRGGGPRSPRGPREACFAASPPRRPSPTASRRRWTPPGAGTALGPASSPPPRGGLGSERWWLAGRAPAAAGCPYGGGSPSEHAPMGCPGTSPDGAPLRGDPGETRASRARGEEARSPRGQPREGCRMRLSLTQRQRWCHRNELVVRLPRLHTIPKTYTPRPATRTAMSWWSGCLGCTRLPT